MSFTGLVKASLARSIPELPLHLAVLAASIGLFFVSPWLLAAGLGAEVAFHVGRAASPRFRERLLAEAREKARDRLLYGLRPDERLRFLQVEGRCRDLARGSAVGRMQADGLGRLASIFLRLLAGRHAILEQQGRDEDHARGLLLGQIADAERRLGSEPAGPTRSSLESTLGILRRRVELLDLGVSRVTYMSAELDRIEQQIGLVADEAALGGESAALAERIGAVLWTLDETRRWLAAEQIDDDMTVAALPGSEG